MKTLALTTALAVATIPTLALALDDGCDLVADKVMFCAYATTFTDSGLTTQDGLTMYAYQNLVMLTFRPLSDAEMAVWTGTADGAYDALNVATEDFVVLGYPQADMLGQVGSTTTYQLGPDVTAIDSVVKIGETPVLVQTLMQAEEMSSDHLTFHGFAIQGLEPEI